MLLITMIMYFVSILTVIYHVSVNGSASSLKQSCGNENCVWSHGQFLLLCVRKAHGIIHNQSFLFHSEAYGMQACDSGMHDSMDEELESCFKGWARCYCKAHGHTVAGQRDLFSCCWDSHYCFHRCMLHSLSVWCVLILFKEGGCQQPRLGKWGLWLYNISFVIRLRNNMDLPL